MLSRSCAAQRPRLSPARTSSLTAEFRCSGRRDWPENFSSRPVPARTVQCQEKTMSEIAYRRDNCRLCGGQDLELVLKLAPTPLADAYVPADRVNQPQASYPLDLFLCRACGFSQLLDVVQPQEI